MGKTLEDCDLGDLRGNQVDEERVIRDIQEILEAPIPVEYIESRHQLNAQQRAAYKAIICCIKDGTPSCFFIDGPGGSGKTFLYCALYEKDRMLKKIVLPTASSGIAASNLPYGRTAHSRFKLPIDTEEHLVCIVLKQGALAALLKRTSLVIWDEAPMANKAIVHSLDLLFRDLMDSDLPFGGKVVVLGVILDKCYLCYRVKRNKRPLKRAWFLLALGDGQLQHDEVSSVSLPSDMLIPFGDEDDPIDILIAHMFPEFLLGSFDSLIFIERAILAPKNDEVDLINHSLIERFPGEIVIFKSIDKLFDDNCNIYLVECLHNLAPAVMSPHELRLKINCPVIFLRNIDPSACLCKGTRLICKKFTGNVILCDITSGFAKGQMTMVHRIHHRPPTSAHLPYQFQRTQFPIKLCFSMTVNKSQGQTLDKCIVYLRQPCFSHGQLYVALSRARQLVKVKVMFMDNNDESNFDKVRNVVSFEVLRRAGIKIG